MESRWRFNAWDIGAGGRVVKLAARLLVNPNYMVTDWPHPPNPGARHYATWDSVEGWWKTFLVFMPPSPERNFPYGEAVESDRM